jgi:hypothetical protein
MGAARAGTADDDALLNDTPEMQKRGRFRPPFFLDRSWP